MSRFFGINSVTFIILHRIIFTWYVATQGKLSSGKVHNALKLAFKLRVCGKNPSAWPFKWTLLISTFVQQCLVVVHGTEFKIYGWFDHSDRGCIYTVLPCRTLRCAIRFCLLMPDKKVKSAFKWSWRLVVLSIIFVDMLKIQWSRSTNMRPLMISYHSKRLNFVPRVSLLREKERPSEWGWKRLRNSKLTKKLPGST